MKVLYKMGEDLVEDNIRKKETLVDVEVISRHGKELQQMLEAWMLIVTEATMVA